MVETDTSRSNLRNIVEGKCDRQIDSYVTLLQQNPNTRFYLRLGYEFDGPWNHYEPEMYKKAFVYIAKRLRASGQTNYETVWQASTSPYGTYLNLGLEAWYPGDEWVDWCGSSWFTPAPNSHELVLRFAREHKKPVFIAEATPQGFDLAEETYASPTGGGKDKSVVTAEIIWEKWFVPLLDFIKKNDDVVGAVSYINAAWDKQRMWGPPYAQGYWGDSRIQYNPYIKERWEAILASGLFLQ